MSFFTKCFSFTSMLAESCGFNYGFGLNCPAIILEKVNL
jgi:hypothetical protein